MISPLSSKLSAVMGAVLTGLAFTSQDVQAAPTTIVSKGPFGLIAQLTEPGRRDPNGPEFVMQYSTMHEGDYTYGQSEIKGRAIDCDDMVAGQKEDGSGLEWKLTGRFLAMSADIADGSAYDAAFKQDKRAVVGASFIIGYKSHINAAHHPIAEVDAVSGFCNLQYPPSNG